MGVGNRHLVHECVRRFVSPVCGEAAAQLELAWARAFVQPYVEDSGLPCPLPGPDEFARELARPLSVGPPGSSGVPEPLPVPDCTDAMRNAAKVCPAIFEKAFIYVFSSTFQICKRDHLVEFEFDPLTILNSKDLDDACRKAPDLQRSLLPSIRSERKGRKGAEGGAECLSGIGPNLWACVEPATKRLLQTLGLLCTNADANVAWQEGGACLAGLRQSAPREMANCDRVPFPPPPSLPTRKRQWLVEPPHRCSSMGWAVRRRRACWIASRRSHCLSAAPPASRFSIWSFLLLLLTYHKKSPLI